MEDEEKYAKRNTNNVTTDNLFQSPVTVNARNKDANVTYQRQISPGTLEETIKEFKGCNIQSTINDSGYSDFDEKVVAINDYEEQVDARNWFRNDSDKQVDAINDSTKQVDAISDSEKLVDT